MPADAVGRDGRPVQPAGGTSKGKRDLDSGRRGSDAGEPDAVPQSPTQVPKAGWVAIVKRAGKQFKHDNVTDFAAALTYHGVLAIFPGALALVSILGLLGKNETNKIVNNISALAPGGVTNFLQSIIHTVQGKAGAAGIALIVGVAIAIWSASGYVAAFMRASNAIYNVDEGRPIWKTIPTRLLVTVALLVMLIASAVIVIVTGPVTSQLGKAFGIGGAATTVWEIAKWPVLLILVSLMLSLLYKASPNVKQPGFRWISLGGIIAVIVWVVASALFAVYVSFSGSYNKTYGSFAAVIIFLVWLWISNIAVLLGAEINAEAQHQRALEAGLPEDVDQFAPLRDTKKLDEERAREADDAARIRQQTMNGQHTND